VKSLPESLVALHVARRFEAGFIPDKFWKERKAALKALLSKPLRDKSPSGIAHGFDSEVVPFFKAFGRDLVGFGMLPTAEQSIKDRVEMRVSILEAVEAGHERFDNALRAAAPYPTQTTEDRVAFSIAMELGNHYEKNFETLGDALKGYWITQPALIKGLAQRVLKKATPEVKAAIDNEEDWGRSSSIRFEFYRTVNLEALSKKLVTREKLDLDPYKWMDFFREMLLSNYSERAVQDSNGLTEFDMYGMKVVIDDSTVTPEETKKYVKYIDEAYHRMNAKKLGKAWYGTFYIKCAECGGVNQNTGGGVGGHYHIGPDTVTCYSRPSKFVVELLAHELGHRYWFKQMSQGQRAKFESLVRVRNRPIRPKYTPRLLDEAKLQDGKEKVNAAAKEFEGVLKSLQSDAARAKKWSGFAERLYPVISKAGQEFEDMHMRGMQAIGVGNGSTPESKSLYNEALKAADDVRKLGWSFEEDLKRNFNRTPEPSGPIADPDKYLLTAFKKCVSDWIDVARQAVDLAVASGLTFLDFAFQSENEIEKGRGDRMVKDWDDAWDNDPRQVMPVSDYGKSNIDEAWAEAFAHYVLDLDMTRDQLESMRSVLSSTGINPLILRVVNRFLA
jgi:hypothetical protein